MMIIQPRLTGIFTPSPEAIDELTARKYNRDFKGREPRPTSEIHAEEARKLVQLQKALGFSVISDGQFSWGDLLRPVYAGMEGIEVGSQTRWFEVNGFVFPPKVAGDPKGAAKSPVTGYLHPELMDNGTVTLVGPYTLFKMAEREYSASDSHLMEAITDQLRTVLVNLPPNVGVVEFCEPGISYDAKAKAFGGLLSSTKYTYDYLSSHVTNQKLILQFPDVDFNEIFRDVRHFRVDGFGVDLTETVTPPKKNGLDGKILSAGILNASSSVPENLDFAAQRVKAYAASSRPASIHVTTNAQLFHTISYEPAVAKVKEIGKLAEMLA